MSAKRIVVCGKGGVGKTTVSAMLARHLATLPDHRALLVDADHAGGLGVALDITPERTIEDVREQALAELKARQSSRKADLSQGIEFRLLQALTERDHLAFLALGRPEDDGCFCGVNSVLKRALELLADQFDTTVVDAEAGLEQINRDVVGDVDFLLLVADPSVKALRVAEAIPGVAKRLGRTPQLGLLLNRVRDPSTVETIRARTTLPLLGALPEDETVAAFDAEARSFFELPDTPATAALHTALAPHLFF